MTRRGRRLGREGGVGGVGTPDWAPDIKRAEKIENFGGMREIFGTFIFQGWRVRLLAVWNSRGETL